MLASLSMRMLTFVSGLALTLVSLCVWRLDLITHAIPLWYPIVSSICGLITMLISIVRYK